MKLKGKHSQSFHDTARWLSTSGIQNQSSKKALRGGVSAWYDIHHRQYPFLYSEITGYALSTFLFLHQMSHEVDWLDKAEAAAEWLVSNACHSSGGVLTRYYLHERYASAQYTFDEGWIYTFDTAMAAYGLLQFQKERPRPAVEAAIHRAYRFLTEVMKKKKGGFYPYYITQQKKPGENVNKWSDQSGDFHAKLALFFIDYHRWTKKSDARDEAVRLLDNSVKSQQRDGRFVTGRKDDSTLLHPHSYALEGLFYGGHQLARKDYLKAAIRGMSWARRAISKNGFVCAFYDGTKFLDFERCDVIAQILRLGSMAYAVQSKAPVISPESLEKIRRRLLFYQFTGDGYQAGGFMYGSDEDSRIKTHLNAWVQ